MKESNLYFSLTNNYKDMSDEDLINVIKSGDKSALEFLISKYKELVNMKVSKFFMIGAEKEDIVQEGLIGNTTAYEEDEDSSLLEVFDAHQMEDPLDTITKKEYYQTVENAIDKSLSDFEKQVLNRYIQGESYIQIAEKLDAPVKSIDNAIQRIRKKAIKNIGEQ